MRNLRLREAPIKNCFNLGRITLPQLPQASKSKDLEVAQPRVPLIERIEREPTRHLPAAAVRMLALRKPEGASAALLAYLPLAEEENLTDEVKKSSGDVGDSRGQDRCRLGACSGR